MTINCKGKLIDLNLPRVMGIINATPDSFYDGGKLKTDISFLQQAEKMLTDGATFLDVGGYSSRPGAADISVEEELKRVLPVIRLILDEFPQALISVDTFRSEVARQSVEAGAVMINDISAGLADPKMLDTVAELKVPYCMMHMKGSPQTMNSLAKYEDVLEEVLQYFSQRISEARKKGINDIITDPGFGFAKNTEHNYRLLDKLQMFSRLGYPVLVGVSRKSMVYKMLDITPLESLNGTTVLNTIALLKGASILRVHDVKEAVECVKLTHSLASDNFL